MALLYSELITIVHLNVICLSSVYKDFEVLLGSGPALCLFLKTLQASARVQNYSVNDY